MHSKQRSRGSFSRRIAALVASSVLASSFLVVGIQGVASATTTIAEATGFPVVSETLGVNSLDVTTATAGDLVIFQSQIHSMSITINSVTNSGTGTVTSGGWHLAKQYPDTLNNLITEEVWWAIVSTPGPMTITANYSASVSNISPQLVADSFTTSSPSTWSVVAANGAAAASTTSITFPNLTSGTQAAQVYWGYVEASTTAYIGNTTNFVYNATATNLNGNLITYNDQLSSSTAYSPNASESPSGTFTAIGAIFAASPVVTSYTVTFNGNGATSGTMSPETASAPTALSTNTFTRSGYTFSGWNTAANDTGGAYADGASYPFTASATLYAQWSPITHTVTFSGNGATTGTTNSETDSAPSPLTGNIFTRAGYIFAGWNTAANGTGTVYADGATYPFNADLTLYAQWTADFNTVTFIGNGANHGSMRSEVANAPAALTPNVFTRTGFTFAGWNTAANGKGTKYTNHESYSFTAKLNLYAQWQRILIPAPHATRIVGTFVAGTTHMVMIVGISFVGTAKVSTNAPGTTIRILNVKNNHIDARVTVKKGTRPGVHVLTIVLHNGKSCTIRYLSR